MTVGDYFLLTVLCAIIISTLAYLHYKGTLYWYKCKGYWDTTDITYIESVIQVLGWFIAFSGIMFLLSVLVVSWNMPI